MEFKQFNDELRKHVRSMTKGEEYLFVVDLDFDKLWNVYLDSFPEGTNEVFRERREYDCSACKHFMRNFGRVVSIKNNEMMSVWDFNVKDEKYQTVIDALSKLVKSCKIDNVFVPVFRNFGIEKSHESLEDSSIRTWYHFYSEVDSSIKVFNKDDIGTISGRMR